MDADWSWIHNRVVSYRLSIAVGSWAVAWAGLAREAQAARTGEQPPADRATWQLQSAEEAVERTRTLIGLTGAGRVQSDAAVVTLSEDNRACTHEQLVDRALWHVVLGGASPNRVAGGSGDDVEYEHHYIVDAETGVFESLSIRPRPEVSYVLQDRGASVE